MTSDRDKPGNRDPLVSIVIPTFNRRRFVTEAIDSALNQTHARCQVIVVDDGSRDGTADFLRQQYGERIVLVEQANQGPGIARNSGIKAASGEFIQFLDADDQLHSQKIEIGLDVFRRRPEVSVVYTHFQFVAPDGETPVSTPPFEQYTDDVFCELLRQTGCRILTSSSMIRAAMPCAPSAALPMMRNFAAPKIGTYSCAWPGVIASTASTDAWFTAACTAA